MGRRRRDRERESSSGGSARPRESAGGRRTTVQSLQKTLGNQAVAKLLRMDEPPPGRLPQGPVDAIVGRTAVILELLKDQAEAAQESHAEPAVEGKLLQEAIDIGERIRAEAAKKHATLMVAALIGFTGASVDVAAASRFIARGLAGKADEKAEKAERTLDSVKAILERKSEPSPDTERPDTGDRSPGIAIAVIDETLKVAEKLLAGDVPNDDRAANLLEEDTKKLQKAAEIRGFQLALV